MTNESKYQYRNSSTSSLRLIASVTDGLWWRAAWFLGNSQSHSWVLNFWRTKCRVMDSNRRPRINCSTPVITDEVRIWYHDEIDYVSWRFWSSSGNPRIPLELRPWSLLPHIERPIRVLTTYNASRGWPTNLIVTAHKLGKSWFRPNCFRCRGGTMLNYQTRMRIVRREIRCRGLRQFDVLVLSFSHDSLTATR